MAKKTKLTDPAPDLSDDESAEVEVLEEPADSIDPYATLSLEKHATQEQIKSAYRKAALRCHPDKAVAAEKEDAHRKFQKIATAYAILSDEKRKRRYDTTGSTAESLDDDEFDWTAFFREQSQAVVHQDAIEQVKREYQGSDEECRDVLQAYQKGEGDMDFIYDRIICSNVLNDDDRFRKYIDEAIKAKQVNSYAKYVKESKGKRNKRVARAKAEEQEAIGLAEELGLGQQMNGKSNGTGGGEDGLKALIRQRQQHRASDFFDRMEAKYGGATKSKRKAMDEPPEELFQKNSKKTTRRK